MKKTTEDAPLLKNKTAATWEQWLAKHHATSDGIWLQILKKDPKRKTMSYLDALEVALCYGWIDGLKHPYDDVSWLQRFTPRKPKSKWSKTNTRHVERLMKAGRMKPAGLAQVDAARKDGRWAQAYASPGDAVVPPDFMAELEKRPKAKAFFETLNRTNTYAIFYRLNDAKKPETRERRMKEFLAMLEQGKKLY